MIRFGVLLLSSLCHLVEERHAIFHLGVRHIRAAARIAREYYAQHRRRGLPSPVFEYGTDDVKKAFRRLLNAAFHCYVMMLWDYVRCVVAYPIEISRQPMA